ncbi:MAG: CoA pyrophosphatase [Myxococcales bacterium]|nr:CoA pyrophosphatase [Myxococcales bacterium]
MPQPKAMFSIADFQATLQHRQPFMATIDGFRPSAVLLPILRGPDEDFVLLTRRTEKVEHHKGQISFPGGRQDPGESILACVLRETYEEVGVAAETIQILGRLDDTWTPTRYIITPFVGVLPSTVKLTANPEEIAELLIIPLSQLLCPDKYEENEMTHFGQSAVVPFFYVGSTIIWGATARILRQFLQLAFQWEAKPCESY